ncbi:unannotated protein [freshwater metagenome]|uniref:Unannotated protein n=1 Tax=freshwater metagenome TaxID=449393 RepID=A0A6J7IDX3_9ZZZZ
MTKPRKIKPSSCSRTSSAGSPDAVCNWADRANAAVRTGRTSARTAAVRRGTSASTSALSLSNSAGSRTGPPCASIASSTASARHSSSSASTPPYGFWPSARRSAVGSPANSAFVPFGAVASSRVRVPARMAARCWAGVLSTRTATPEPSGTNAGYPVTFCPPTSRVTVGSKRPNVPEVHASVGARSASPTARATCRPTSPARPARSAVRSLLLPSTVPDGSTAANVIRR